MLSEENRALIEAEFPMWLKNFGDGYWTMKPQSLERLLNAVRAEERARAAEVVGSDEAVERAAQAIVDERWNGSHWKAEHMAQARAAIKAALSTLTTKTTEA